VQLQWSKGLRCRDDEIAELTVRGFSDARESVSQWSRHDASLSAAEHLGAGNKATWNEQ